MPICISPDLPAFHILSEENIFVMDSDRAAHQDIRPLRVLVLNLMPKKLKRNVSSCGCSATHRYR